MPAMRDRGAPPITVWQSVIIDTGSQSLRWFCGCCAHCINSRLIASLLALMAAWTASSPSLPLVVRANRLASPRTDPLVTAERISLRSPAFDLLGKLLRIAASIALVISFLVKNPGAVEATRPGSRLLRAATRALGAQTFLPCLEFLANPLLLPLLLHILRDAHYLVEVFRQFLLNLFAGHITNFPALVAVLATPLASNALARLVVECSN